MGRVAVVNRIKVYQINDEDVPLNKEVNLEVHSYWNENSKVVLFIDGKRYTVVAEDLKTAIENAQNTNHH